MTLAAESKNPGLQFVGWSGGSCGNQSSCKLEHAKGTETDTASFELGPPSSPPAGTAYAYFDAEAPSEGSGTKQAPFRSTHALEALLERREEEIAHEHGEVSPLELLFAGGEYEGLEFTSAKEISVYGDLNPSTWKAEREPTDPTRFVGTPQGLLLKRGNGSELPAGDLPGQGSLLAWRVGLRGVVERERQKRGFRLRQPLHPRPRSNGGAGGAGGPGGPGAGGEGGEGGPSFAIAGGGSVELGTGVLEEVARPGEGGEPGGEGGRPAHSGGGGPNEPCSASCKVNATLPVQLPSVVTVSKGVIVITIGCLEACAGKLTLTGSFGKHHVKGLALAAKRGGGTSVLGRLSFSLPAKKLAKLHIHLSKAVRKQLQAVSSMKATLTVELKLGKAKKTKRTQAIELVGSAASKPAKAK